MADRTVSVALIARVEGLKAGFAAGAKSARDLGAELDKTSKTSLHQVELAAAGAGAALLGLAGWAVKAGMEFDRQMSEVSAVSNVTRDELGRLRQAALDAGKATQYSATEAAKAEAELAKAGLGTADILGGALTGSLALAAAGNLDLAESADVAAKAMNTFELKGGDVAHIADQLAGGANATATDVHQLGEALKMSGLAAHAAGMSFDDTVTVLGAFADHSLVGSDAGTSLKTMLMMLQAPTEKAAATMQQLGLKVYDANGNMVDAYTLAGQLQKTLGGLTQEQRNAALATIFGADAMRAANVLYGLGEQGLRDYNKRIGEQADASRVAGEKTDNLAGDIERLTGALETLAIESGSGVAGGLRFLVQTLDHLVSSVSGIPAPVQAALVVLTGLSGAALLAAAGWLKVRGTVRDALQALREAGPVGQRAASGLSRAAAAAGRLSAALTAVSLVSAALATDTQPQIDSLSDSLAEYGKSGAVAGVATRLLGDNAEHLGYYLNAVANSGWWADTTRGIAGFTEGITGLGGVMDESLQHAKERLDAVDAALAQMVQSGNADQAKAAFDRLAAVAAENDVSLHELTVALPNYASALEQAATGTVSYSSSAQKAAARTDSLAGSLQAAIDKGRSLKDVFDQLNGATLGWREAERGAESAVDDLVQALKDSNGSLNVHHEKGRAAAAAVDALAEAAAAAAQAKYDETGSVKAANKVYDAYIEQLRKTLLRAGHTKKEVDGLIKAIASMPKTKTVNIKVNATVDVTGQAHLNRVIKEMQRFGEMRWGGIRAARDGLLNAGIYDGGPLYMFAEPETGGEAFIPRRGDRGRSMGILSEAASWYGAQVVPYRGGMGGGQAIQVTVPVTLLDSQTGEVTRRALVRSASDRGIPPETVSAAYP